MRTRRRAAQDRCRGLAAWRVWVEEARLAGQVRSLQRAGWWMERQRRETFVEVEGRVGESQSIFAFFFCHFACSLRSSRGFSFTPHAFYVFYCFSTSPSMSLRRRKVSWSIGADKLLPRAARLGTSSNSSQISTLVATVARLLPHPFMNNISISSVIRLRRPTFPLATTPRTTSPRTRQSARFLRLPPMGMTDTHRRRQRRRYQPAVPTVTSTQCTNPLANMLT